MLAVSHAWVTPYDAMDTRGIFTCSAASAGICFRSQDYEVFLSQTLQNWCHWQGKLSFIATQDPSLPVSNFYLAFLPLPTIPKHIQITRSFLPQPTTNSTLSTQRLTLNMQFNSIPLLLTLTLYLTNVLSIPVSESSPEQLSPFEERRSQPPPKTPSGPPPANCPTQKPIAQNLCNSGSPYCCSGTGSGQVCGPAASTTCTATTICCINTNGVS